MLRRMLFAAAAGFCLAVPCQATTVSPLNIEMTPSGVHSRAQITVSNTSSNPIAIEPQVETLVMEERGGDRRRPDDDDFLILPAQALIAPGETQVFRVQWVGDGALAEGKSFLVTMAQLPVSGAQGRSALALSVSFAVAVNVGAAGVMPVLRLVASGVKHDRRGRLRPYVVVDNPTATHALLKDAAITLASDQWSTTLAAGSLVNNLGTGLVQPHHRRQFLLPIDLPRGVKGLRVSLDYRPGG
ncbi:fimbria/pilus periplasmic chaperone [Hyphomicrobium sp. DY-1]|jgi:P pilus assembly chaperone PapD|uniref:fimbria/pilus periplasmic chaperone n=1 Tax=Hyphomicrobium sp. DY-1 TaxID=3075650 RepID=UPI0039C29DBF